MDKINFSFRDYVSYMLPGALVIFAGFLIKQNGMDWLENHKFVSGIVFLLGGYMLGSILNTISHMIITRWMRKKQEKSKQIMTFKNGHIFNNLDPAFKGQLEKLLLIKWGTELLYDGSEDNLLMLCLRQSQKDLHPAHETLDRQVSLYEFLVGMIVAIPIFSILSAFGGHFVIGLLVLPLTYFAAKRYWILRRRYIVNVFRIFFVQNIGAKQEDIEGDGDPFSES